MRIWSRISGCLLLALMAILVVAGEARAEGRQEFAASPLLRVQLPPDQRRQMRQEMRDQWLRNPQDDRARWRDDRQGRWQQMPQEDRQRMRDEMRGRRDDFGGQGRGREGGGGGQRGGWR